MANRHDRMKQKWRIRFPHPEGSAELNSVAQGWSGTSELSSVFRQLTGWIILLAFGVGCNNAKPPTRGRSQPWDFQVASSSMAPSLVGPSLRAACSTCGQATLVAAETAQPTWLMRCPACGGVCDLASTIIPGQMVKVVPVPPSELDTPKLQRFDRIVFQSGSADVHQVKRVWGLPDEQVEFRDGELWIDDKLYQKNLDELQRVSVPVARFPPLEDGGLPRFPGILEDPHSQKSQLLDRVAPGQRLLCQFRRPARVTVAEEPRNHWLQPSPLVDDYVCNQGISRRLQVVGDFLLNLELTQPLSKRAGTGLELQFDGLGVRICVAMQSPNEIDTNGNVSVKPLPGFDLETVNERTEISVRVAGWRQMEFACCDRQLLIRSDVQSLIVPLPEQTPIVADSTFEFRIVCRQSESLMIKRINLSRDIYLSSSTAESSGVVSWKVPSQCYFVLGDNLPVSLDSRGSLGCVHRRNVVGRIR